MKKTTTLEKLAIGTVSVAALKLLIGGATIVWGGKTFSLGVPDAAAIGTVLGPVLGAYATSLHKSFRDKDGDGIPDDQEVHK